MEVVPRLPVPEVQLAVVRARDEHVVVVDGHGVDDGVVARDVVQELAFGALPLLHVVGRGGGEGVLGWVQRQRAHRLLVVGEHCGGAARHEVPQPYGAIHGAGDDLRLERLRLDAGDSLLVAAQGVHGVLGAHVPHARHAVATASDEQVKRRVQREAVDAREVAVVVAYDTVVLEVPALDHLVLAGREEVGRARAHRQPSDRRDVPGQRELEHARREVPHLDRAVGRAGDEPLVRRVDGDGAHPPQVARHHAHQLPRCVPLRLGYVVTHLVPPNAERAPRLGRLGRRGRRALYQSRASARAATALVGQHPLRWRPSCRGCACDAPLGPTSRRGRRQILHHAVFGLHLRHHL
mmetsp:Transcript_6636/g.15606  ORF Transcript_6636/g.15606 Transcript_6636/m.15606 type:complete len:351 (+) Transcript_6636:377-1429(+)